MEAGSSREREMEVRRDRRRLSPEGGCEMDTLRKKALRGNRGIK